MLDEKTTQVLDLYNKGLELYKHKKFAEAKDFFQQALVILPEDGPSQLYFDRCTLLIKEPPPEDWDGVFTMTTK